MKKDVIIVGGGASGMIAAISAAQEGGKVTILERNSRIGKKILATGNGRCNFTNINTDICHYNGHNPKFAYSALSQFKVKDTIKFFERLGIGHKVEELGKVFPMSDQASSILDVLLYELSRLNVEIICNTYVKDITKRVNTYNIKLSDNKSHESDSIILATGGKSMPSSGSDGNGYDLARKMGHKVTDIFPALVQLKLEGDYFNRIQGVKINASAELIYKNKSLKKDKGDILFTNYGISGPPILQISRMAGELLNKNKEANLKVSIMDTFTKEELRKKIKQRFKESSGKTIEFSLVGLINKRLIPIILKEAGIKDLKVPAANISLQEIEQIVNILINWTFKISGTKGWNSSQVTAGGIDTNEINQTSMESKIAKGLFFAGEIIDVDGLCGGYNLQWAWSSGYIAGKNAMI